MPVCYKHKLIFIHIPKCAGSTIEKILNLNNLENFYSVHKTINTGIVVEKNKFNTLSEYYNCGYKTPQHLTLRELKRVLPKIYFNSYKKFTVVRNPYSRFVSDFCYSNYYPSYAQTLQGYTFEQFVEQLKLPETERIKKFDGHLEPQYTYLIDDNNLIQDIEIYYYEELNTCFNYLKTITDCADIPHLLKTVYGKPYQEYYTSDLQEKVYDFYKEDFLQFNYKFNL